MVIGNTFEPSLSPKRSIRARTEPITTGFTISKCDGLNAKAKCTSPPGVAKSDEKPMWYFTSPEPLLAACLPANSSNKSCGFLPSTLTKTFKRPRCAIPITASFVPCSPARLINAFSIGMRLSPPSNEKRFAPGNFEPKYFSRPSAAISSFRIFFCCSDLNSGRPRTPSRRC